MPRLAELAARAGGEVVGDGERVIAAFASLEDAGPEDLSLYCEALSGSDHAAHFVVLLPSLDVALAREQARPTEWHRAGHLEAVYERFAAWQGVAKVDPDELAPDLVADRVMSMAAEGRALLSDASRSGRHWSGFGDDYLLSIC